jgi:7-cyano-7-deazaguanine synthase in queuosine biosynthesis
VTDVQLRTAPDQPDHGAAILLDWFEDRGASTVQYEPDFLKGLAPSPVALDLFRLAGAIFCADKTVRRAEATDFWTRDISLTAPVSDVDLWESVAGLLVRAVSFLSGDRWRFDFVEDTVEPLDAETISSGDDAVTLFSGGLDSLAGAIDLLEAERNLTLVGHHDGSLTLSKQEELYRALGEHYGTDRVSLRKLLLRPAARRISQARPLADGVVENTTRARSFLFVAAGVAVADALESGLALYVPENGYIGINVPLSPARAGSLSTRTTHPFFMDLMAALLDQLGLAHEIENPYRLLTKGEALAASSNPALLAELAPRTISCAHPEAPRWRERPQGNCGYCYPCLIRRAALHRFGSDGTQYSWDALTDTELLRRDVSSGGSLRALAQSLGRPESPNDVLRNGRIPGGEAPAFYETYRRGRAELRTWLLSGAGPELQRRLGST